ncbi:PREDICTED: SH3 domain-containing kinase-binding protein 1-like, partial [Tinamus guttatus]|uniref:SH3 domain-containing kinase-binding protein 1-like n=1 Tax=Tinamus guttatus TaxID=94827 RepID=UPI00052F014F
MFPSNFIKELAESDDAGIALEEQAKPRKSAFEGAFLYRVAPAKIDSYRRYNSLKDATGSESDGGDSCSTKSEGANGGTTIQPKKVKGVGFGDIFKDKPIKLRPRSIEVDNDFLPVDKSVGKKLPPATATQEPTKIEVDSRTKTKEYCKVIFPYEAQNDDELTIREGDVVTLISKDCIDVGWWEGELNGRRGVFPDNFVKLLPSDFEKERPKKPPPPSAPVIKQGSGTTDRKHEIKKIPPERPECLPNRTEEKERSEREQKQLDLQKPSVPAIPPKKPRPPKANSVNRPGTLPPRRPERPVVPVTHTRSDSPKVELAGSAAPGTLEKDSSERSNDIGRLCNDHFCPGSKGHFCNGPNTYFCPCPSGHFCNSPKNCLCSDRVCPDSSGRFCNDRFCPSPNGCFSNGRVCPSPNGRFRNDSDGGFCNGCFCPGPNGCFHPGPNGRFCNSPKPTSATTASAPAPMAASTPAPMAASAMSSLSSPDFFDSPSPEDDREEHVSITQKTIEVSRKSRTVTISQ